MKKKIIGLAGILISIIIPVFFKYNVSAYYISSPNLNWAQTGTPTTPFGSHTQFGMSFYLDGQYYNETCYCSDPSINNFMTPSGPNPFYSCYTGASARDVGNSIYVTFTGRGASWALQPITCIIDKPRPTTYTLTAHAIEENGSAIEYYIDSDTVNEGGYASVYNKYYSNYDFLGWKSSIYGGYISTSSSYGTYLYSDQTVYAVYRKETCVPGDWEKNGAAYEVTPTITTERTEVITPSSGVTIGGNGLNGTYEIGKVDSVKVDFRHILQQPSNGLGQSINVSYRLDSSSYNSTSIPNRSSIAITSYKTVSNVGPRVDDARTQVCQSISFNSKTWDYKKTQINLRQPMIQKCYYPSGRYDTLNTRTDSLLGSSSSAWQGRGDSGSSNACAYLHRPWNFKVTSIDNNSSSSGEIVYAGDEIEPSFKINVVKNNENFSITDIPNATINLCAGIKDRETCTNIHTNKTVHAESGKIDSSTSYSYHNIDSFNAIVMGDRIVVEDVPAGTEYCVRLSITPTNSGNGYYNNFNWNPTYSERKCYIVAKKPMVQVWGGNIVSGGNIKSGFTKKPHGTYGSWDELVIVAGGQIAGFASGASLAGGAKDATNNKLTVLTLANANLTSYLGGDFNPNLSKIRKDKEAVLEKIETSYEVLNVLPDSPVSGKKYVKVNGNLLIDKNIQYVESATVLDDMPKLFIYATGNINIRCDVTRIDAIIVADGTINTCTDNNGITPERDTRARSKQLMVNGMIIANELQLNRMYGAAAGEAYSAIPAEIINYDSLVELMTIEKLDDGKTGFNVVYTQESAVRY